MATQKKPSVAVADIQTLPLLPLRDVVVFPHMMIPLFIARKKSIHALEAAMTAERTVVFLSQKNAEQDEPASSDLFQIGCLASISEFIKMADGTIKVLVEGRSRVKVLDFVDAESYQQVEVQILPEEDMEDIAQANNAEIEVLHRAVVQSFGQFVKSSKKVPGDILGKIGEIRHPGRLADTIAAHLPFEPKKKQGLLELLPIPERLELLFSQLEHELELADTDKRIRARVKKQIDKNQREFHLAEQLKAIHKELGDSEDDLDDLESRLKAARMPKAAWTKAAAELKKLKTLSSQSAEAGVVRNYLEVLADLPWSKKNRVKHDLAQAQKILDDDHYGLERVKERILEYLAVQSRVGKLKAPILCLVGPPGVGKTSLGQSIAKATGRKYVRMALGGVHDEAEIRGHRRTYVGAMPGKVLQSLSKVATRNPLFLLDEIDKLGADYRGDPSSALLEVLDPEQNHSFADHYVELDFDLSDVMFVATSNSLNIPPALLDRMEVIHLSGYTEDEKLHIATQYLLPKQMQNNGVKATELLVQEDAIRDIVRYYTREAGVRSLERELSRICRKVVKGIQLATIKKKTVVKPSNLADFLGVRKFTFGQAENASRIGLVQGLAWTGVGGDLLTIEVATMQGKGRIKSTGSLGDVMKESVEAACTVVRSRSSQMGIEESFFEKHDLHVHVPAGGTPKDGPSAGAAITTGLISALTGIAVRRDVAMTGEITLRGEVTEIGGLKEKLLAALRGGIQTVIIPEENRKDLQEIPDNVKAGLKIVPVRWIEEVLSIALEQKIQTTINKKADSVGMDASAAPVRRKKTVPAQKK